VQHATLIAKQHLQAMHIPGSTFLVQPQLQHHAVASALVVGPSRC
jgi:hypothetical protein